MSNIEYKVKYYDKKKTKKTYESWYLNGRHHREDGIACISYYEGGQVEFEGWCLNGEYHRKDGPAVIRYHEGGQVEFELWYLNGEWPSEETVKQLKLEIEADRCIEEMLE